MLSGEKERDLTYSYAKISYINRKFKKQIDTQKRHKNVPLHSEWEQI